MNPTTITIKVTDPERINEALELIETIKKNHPNATVNIEVIF
jgi:hypothetical protein